MISNEQLYAEAKRASKKAYAPYSKFQVGAALLTRAGVIYRGCNVENASYGNTICAERTAIVKAVSEGDRDIEAIAVYTESGDLSPCGACRQFISEFGADIQVVYRSSEQIISKAISELLPDSFSDQNLR
ncbi:MAG: cytidine deaminase [Cyanobacteria bacterium P01_D01_bin.73]